MVAPRETSVDEREFRERFANYTRTLDCIHCGLCIPHCPTHDVTAREASSPRGRIHLLRSWAEGSLSLSPAARLHLDQCIACRACETVCPAGVRMGEIVESFRVADENARPNRGWRRRAARWLADRVLPSRRRLALLTDLLWLYRILGLRWVVGKVLGRCSPRLAHLHALLPPMPAPMGRRLPTARRLPGGCYPAIGPPRLRVALFLGCVTSEWFAPTMRAAIRVLRRNGCEVLVPDGQTCCGALHRHAGFGPEAVRLYRKNREAFAECGADVVAVTAAGCGLALKEPPAGWPEDLGIPVRDVCELLDEIGITAPGRECRQRVVYDQPCHLLHGQKIGREVIENLLGAIPGIDLVALEGSERCCGSGGVYNAVHVELARALGRQKAAAIVASRPDVVVSGNAGCILQLRSALAGTGIEVSHPIELLDRAYGQ